MLPSSAADGPSRFPKLKECAHFHYDIVDLGAIQLNLDEEHHDFHDTSFNYGTSGMRSTDSGAPVSSGQAQQQQTKDRSWRLSESTSQLTGRFYIRVSSRDRAWVVRQSYEGFCNFDRQLHRCIYDRKYSLLPELESNEALEKSTQDQRKLLSIYLRRFSAIACNMINCGPVLTWMEMDNRGNHLVASENCAINVPALAAGHVVKRYMAQSLDELTLEVGSIVSIIDMPPSNESTWWQGKCKFEVGFFPSECVQVISGIVPESVATKLPPKPVLRRRGKLISFLRSFFSSRPTRAQLKQTGIVKERVFGCDLGEHLLNSGHDVPLVLQVCASAIESHGIVDGIYRLSGVASNIQKLRNAFDEDRVPELTDDLFVQDVHCISSLLKMYFRELPNPLFTYLLYDKFALAMEDDDQRLTTIYDVVQQLPPPHYRTASYLMRHLCRVASHSTKTNMHCKNLAIVWAPNLFRSKELEQIQCSTAALSGVGIQAIITEYLIMYADVIFADGAGNAGVSTMRHRPKSLMPLPSKLLSLEEAQERALLKSPCQKYIDVGGGPTALPNDYHTVVDLRKGCKKPRKDRKASLSNLKAIFSRSRSGSYRSNGSDRGSLNDPQFQVKYKPPVKPRAVAAVRTDTSQRRQRMRAAKSVDALFYGGMACGDQFDDGHTIANPYAEDHWSYVSQGSSQGSSALGGRPRTKSCNSSLSDSSDLEERCTTFIKPLQSSPQNSLKRRARHTEAPSGVKTSSFFSQRQLEQLGRSHGKENCDIYRSIALGVTTQPKISLSSRFNIPPEVPKRSTSLYIDCFDKNLVPSHPDPFLVISKSLATVDSYQSRAPMTLPIPPPRSYSPRYSSSPSQSDHSDEVFNYSFAPTESEHPLTPICELLNTSGRTWETASYDTPAKFSLWLDSLYQERPSGKLEVRSASCRSSVGDTSFTAPMGSAASGFEVPGPGKESEDLATGDLLQRDDLSERWEVPTLVSGSAFVTDVNEFLDSQSANIPCDTYVSSDVLRSQLGLLQFSCPASELSRVSSGSDVHGRGSRPDSSSFAGEEMTQTLSASTCFMDCSAGSELENDITPTEERLRVADAGEPASSSEKEHFGAEGRGDLECLRRGEVAEEQSDAHGGWGDYFTGDLKELEHSEGRYEQFDESGKDFGRGCNDTNQLESEHEGPDDFGSDSGLMECLEVLKERELYRQSVERDLLVQEATDNPKAISMETGHVSPHSYHDNKGTMQRSQSVSDPSEFEKPAILAESLDTIPKSRTKSAAPNLSESFDSDDHIGHEELWSAGFNVAGRPMFQENDSFVEQIRKLHAASAISYNDSTDLAAFDSDSGCRSTQVIGAVPSHDSLEPLESHPRLQGSDGKGDDLPELMQEVDCPGGTTAFQVVATAIKGATEKGPTVQEDDALKGDDHQRSWVCVAMTGIPNPEKSVDSAESRSSAAASNPTEMPGYSELSQPYSSHANRNSSSIDTNRRDVEVDDMTSWKTSLSLASCLRQLCADGYVADRSNSCSPVLTDRNISSQTIQQETPYDDFIDTTSKPETTDTTDETVSLGSLHVVEPQTFRSNSVPSEAIEVLLSYSDARGENVGKETMSEEPDLPHEDERLSSGRRILCSSESDVCASSAELARYSSPVRRKSVRELKNRFESTADEGVPVKTTVKKRPPVAKKPSVARSALMSKSLPKCDSSAPALDAGSDKAAVSGPESAPDCGSFCWSDGWNGALPGAFANQTVDYASLMESYSSDTAEAAMRRSYEACRPSSAASTASCESFSSESRALSGHASLATNRKPRSHSLHATSIPDVLGLLFTASNDGSKETYKEEHTSEFSSYLDPTSSCPDGALEGSSSTQSVQRFETKGAGERCFAAIAYCDPKSLTLGADDPKEISANASASASECRINHASESGGGVAISRRAPVPARRNPRRSEGRTDYECLASGSVPGDTDRSSGVDDRDVSSCDSLGMESCRAEALNSGARGESAARPRPTKPSRASPDRAPREPSVGRVRGLSAMFEQQSLDRAEGPSGRREQPLQRPHPHNPSGQDFSGRSSQGWRTLHASNGEGEMAANPALRNLTIKL